MSWDRLSELAEQERELVEAGSWEGLAIVQAERDRLIASLPTPPPREARPVLEAALRRSRETEAALADGLAGTADLLAALRRGRRAVGAYATAARSRLDAHA